MQWLRLLLVLPALAALGAAQAQSVEVLIAPSADVSIFSSGDNIADAKGSYLWTSVLASGTRRRMLLRFDLSSIPPGSLVHEVSLELYQSRARGDHDVRVHRIQSAWTTGQADGGGQGEGAPATNGDVTWGYRSFSTVPGAGVPWNAQGGDFDTEPSAVLRVAAASQWYSWRSLPSGPGALNPKLSADVQAWIDNPAGNQGWMLIGDEGAEQNAKRFQSTRSGSEAPRLRVIYTPAAIGSNADVPLPGWALLLLGGSMAAALWRRSGRQENP